MKTLLRLNFILTLGLFSQNHLHSQFTITCLGGSAPVNGTNNQELNFQFLSESLTITGFDCLGCSTGITTPSCRWINNCISYCEAMIPEEPEFSQIVDDCIYDCGIEF